MGDRGCHLMRRPNCVDALSVYLCVKTENDVYLFVSILGAGLCLNTKYIASPPSLQHVSYFLHTFTTCTSYLRNFKFFAA